MIVSFYIKKIISVFDYLIGQKLVNIAEKYKNKVQKNTLMFCRVGCENCYRIGCPVRSKKLSKTFIKFEDRHKKGN